MFGGLSNKKKKKKISVAAIDQCRRAAVIIVEWAVRNELHTTIHCTPCGTNGAAPFSGVSRNNASHTLMNGRVQDATTVIFVSRILRACLARDERRNGC